MFTVSDFCRYRKYPSLCKQVVDLHNEYFLKLVRNWVCISALQTETSFESYQKSFDSLIECTDKICMESNFEILEESEVCIPWNTIDEAFGSYLHRIAKRYFGLLPGKATLYEGNITGSKSGTLFCISIVIEGVKNETADVYVYLYHKKFKEEKIRILLSEWEQIIPYLEFILKNDYSEFEQRIESLKNQVMAAERVSEMNKSALEVFIQGVCQRNNLVYSIKKDNRGMTVKISLPQKLSLDFRIKPEEFEEKRDVIKELLEKIGEMNGISLS